jgi:error-prone DNA polymerase
VQDYAAISLSLKAHPVSFLREKLDRLHIVAANQLANIADGSAVKIAGLVLVRQRPSTAKGVCFITLEDETGVCNIVVFENLFKKYRREIIQSKLLMIEGRLQREGEVIHVITKSCHNFSSLLYKLVPDASQLPALETVSRADEKTDPALMQNRKATAFQQPKLFPDGRNFK